ncbi:MAG TPA: acetylxylan esterase [Bacillota bacterium]|nr:acetylxylan esterase [Bacillota bacterium]
MNQSVALTAALCACLHLCVSAWAAEPARGPQVVVTCDPPEAVFTPGQPIRWQVAVKGDGCSNIVEASYTLKKGGLTVMCASKLALTNVLSSSEGQRAGEVVTTMNEPGTLLLEVKVPGTDGKPIRALGGAVVQPGSIRPSASRPRDFDAFWKAKVKELKKVPANPQLVPGESGKSEVDYWQITMDNIRGTHINGQLARPKAGGKLPALLIVQWAGVYGLQKGWVTDRAAGGWLVLNINPHDLPIDQPEEFYQQQSKGALKDYAAIGNDNRDTSYFLRMYLSCYRAAQYLAERPDWDGKTLVVAGTSQGGQQTLMTAGLHPRITAALACVPAGCDMTGPQVGRSPGWPAWFYKTEGKDPAKVIEASRYYDDVNFASRIKCPVLVGIGLVDETCPPAGILAAINQTKGPKEILLLPRSDHQGKNNTQAAYYERFNAWLNALQQGKPAPVKTY